VRALSHGSSLKKEIGAKRDVARALGIGTCVLRYVETKARDRSRRLLEVDVYERNAPAQRLYTKYGFKFTYSARMRTVMRGSKRVSLN
jgi:GNAT superfamily N-acetyltransferase